jgi:hypothetical protein
MAFKISDIAATIPSGGRIVAMCEHQGQVILATEQHVFRGRFDTGDFEQMCFRMLKETETDNGRATKENEMKQAVDQLLEALNEIAAYEKHMRNGDKLLPSDAADMVDTAKAALLRWDREAA